LGRGGECEGTKRQGGRKRDDPHTKGEKCRGIEKRASGKGNDRVSPGHELVFNLIKTGWITSWDILAFMDALTKEGNIRSELVKTRLK